jgi:hypothetical protein
MPIHGLIVPLFHQLLGALGAVLRKGEAFAEARKIDPVVLLHARLAPDMFPLSRQVQIASDTAKAAAGRLGGVEVPRWADDESTFAHLQDRIGKTLRFVDSVPASQIDQGEDREISIPAGRDGTLRMKGRDYAIHWVIPHFVFHVATTYDILRHNGVELGKRDFIGEIPLLTPHTG